MFCTNYCTDRKFAYDVKEIIEKNADRKKLERKRKNKMNEGERKEIEWAGHMVRKKKSEERKKEYKDTLPLSQNR